MFIDADGDLCLTSPSHKSDRLKLDVSLPEEWDSTELRGVYRHKFGRKPPGSSYEDKAFETVKAHWRWSQNGLLVGPIEPAWEARHRRPRREDDEEEDKKTGKPADLFNHVPVPGLNAADIDLRGLWQVPLNVQRSEFLRGPLFAAFCERYMSLAAEMWEELLKLAGMRDDLPRHRAFVEGLLERSDWQLRTLLKQRGIELQPASP
jgi:hypothetical protein